MGISLPVEFKTALSPSQPPALTAVLSLPISSFRILALTSFSLIRSLCQIFRHLLILTRLTFHRRLRTNCSPALQHRILPLSRFLASRELSARFPSLFPI